MNFYIIESLKTTNAWHYNEIILDGKYDWTYPPLCPHCGRQLRRYVSEPLNIDMDIAQPYFCDIIYDYEFIYVTELFRSLFEKSGLKGIENFREVTLNKIKTYNGVRKAKLPEPPPYYLADVVVDGAAIDLKKSKAVFEWPDFCHYCMGPTDPHDEDGGNLGLVKYNGYYIDRSRWNGNSIFVALGVACQYAVDQRFKEWFESNHLKTGCQFLPEQDSFLDETDEEMTNTYTVE